ncbi:bifunctional ornithine acetyltransferase/N-acetylglutamate synthase [Pullulanibacillus sp. KACC 23026]|uniref:bifunctional ornithine acetyltransferase/N-acetylglutamate synthase n=1 Tax=Pullulanibacillus sp. KACC 23026 TaxID=3028315 RepID=UPI0023AEF9D0|nr:bifunctional ornithine acetyltransferase/N-acetylglutamate synthase [Pullulanibacillus sp. KACC 23026]WEG13064.1 bifunctional ornithine acetyltransferase/N-acetylglutamate synthase [Pullulanibacillus sp. KACC 23026]
MTEAKSLTLDKDKQTSLTVLDEGGVTSPKGFRASGLHCGLRKTRLDLGWLYSDVPAAACGVYTTNVFQAAPLLVTKESLSQENKLQAILVNSGNANACTGQEGLSNAYESRTDFAKQFGIPEHYISVVSTGVIGQQLPMEKLKQGIKNIGILENDAASFEKAILTTDTVTKHLAVELEIDGKTVTIGGAAKGSGMIHPNMATMLGFVTTDANVVQEDLYDALKEVTNSTFNMITVDGDMSTNDMVLVLANGLAGNEPLSKAHPEWETFKNGLAFVSEALAKKIARDGEGATKLIEVQVTGALEVEAAKVIAKTIVGSSLVKTAIYGTDANWGRIICAVGYSGKPIDPTNIHVAIGPVEVVKDGVPLPFDEDIAKAYLENEHVQIFVNLNQGQHTATAWGCDLTYDYVKINAMYRT